MTLHKPPGLATALLKLIAGRNDALVGDLHEQFQSGRSHRWYWRQVVGIGIGRCLHDPHCLRVVVAWTVFIGVPLATSPFVGWWGMGRLAVAMLLGIAITSWKLWWLHRTSLVILYAASVAMVLPHWMLADRMVPTSADRLFWAIAQVLAGYGVVGVLLVPFLILRLGRSGPLAERPISLSLSR